ncbi:PA2169 family four-helix-bundle protein [Runella sp.]|jgi:uncharacterized protein (TIGR02284 family)|uniref:ferritin-like domain-containing protein n=1 Tax=Runella sp. TaxID=1960881 RepID=UPI0026359AD1|nr:PA2169 family four-helix-bundle protein [Runella sp.]
MNTDKTIDVLNTLIVINNDRIEGYETASDDTEHADLKALFTQFQQTSRKCKMELVNEVNRLEGTPDEGTRLTGKLYRKWMDIKAALTGNDRKAVIDWCEYGEDVASDAYQEAINENLKDLSTQQQAMLKEQHLSLKADHDKVRTMRDLLIGV